MPFHVTHLLGPTDEPEVPCATRHTLTQQRKGKAGGGTEVHRVSSRLSSRSFFNVVPRFLIHVSRHSRIGTGERQPPHHLFVFTRGGVSIDGSMEIDGGGMT